MNHVTSSYSPTSEILYGQRMRSLADHYGAALVDLNAIAHGSWAWMTNQGYSGNPTNPGPSGNESIHMSTAGLLWSYNQIAPLVTAMS